jgi:hypothetical protein
MLKRLALCLAFLVWATGAQAQAVGGTIIHQSFSTASSNVPLPASNLAFRFVVIAPANITGNTQEFFYKLGNSSVSADLTTSIPLPPGGWCTAVGPATNIAGITAASNVLINITQVTVCPPAIGFSFLPTGSGPPVTGSALLLTDATDNLLLVDGSDNLCLSSSTSC